MLVEVGFHQVDEIRHDLRLKSAVAPPVEDVLPELRTMECGGAIAPNDWGSRAGGWELAGEKSVDVPTHHGFGIRVI